MSASMLRPLTSARAGQKIKDVLGFSDGLVLPKQSSSIAPDHVWSNADQDPVLPELRTWTGWTFTFYWFSDLVTAAGWSAASSVVTLGLTSTDAILITLVAAFCNAIPTVLNGSIGADLHIPFPIAIRASYGYWFSYFCVVTRGVLALFWFGVQSAYGAQCVTEMITAIWPSFATLPNHLSAAAGITTSGMISYAIYWCIQTPFMLIPTHRLHWMFWAKSVLVTPTALAMVIWISVRAGNAGDFFNEPSTVHGSIRAWLWLSSLTSITGGFSTLAVNIPDFSRFSKHRTSHYAQLPMIPFFKCIVGVLGVVAASASTKLYGKTLWSPLSIIAMWQGSPGGRAAAFFAAAVWMLAQICVNISANSVSFGNDITTLAPKWFNLRRGVIFAAFVGGWVMCPWIIIESASSLLAFMGGYACFLAPIAGIMFSDYWIVKKRRYDVPALYDPRGIYSYQYGTNWRALATTLLVTVPLLPGLANKISPDTVSIGTGMERLFAINWLYGFVTSIVLYVGMNLLLPDTRTLIPAVIHGIATVYEGSEPDTEGSEHHVVDHEKRGPSMEASGAAKIGLVAVA